MDVMNGVVTEPMTLAPWIPNHHRSIIRNTHTRYPGRPVTIASIGAISLLITENTSIPKLLAIKPITDTHRIVITAGNNTEKDLDTFGGTLSGNFRVSLPDWISFTYTNVASRPITIPTNRPVADVYVEETTLLIE